MDDRFSALFDRVQGMIMAFLLPGLVTLFAGATVNETIRTWFEGAANGPTFAGLIFVVLAGSALGFVLTAIRFVIFERVSIGGSCLVGPSPRLDETKRKDHAVEYLDLRLQHYYHYLAYANLAVAIPIGILIWIASLSWSQLAAIWLRVAIIVTLGVIATIALCIAGCDAVRRYDERRTRLLGLVKDDAA